MLMNPDRVHLQRLLALDIWQCPTEIEPLPGGITNHNFVVRTAGRAYVARVCVERELLGINRRNEVVCQRAAQSLGVAPAVVHHENGVLVSEYVEARTLTAADVRAPGLLPRLASLLRTLHDGWDKITGELLYFSAFQTVRTYARTARELGARLPDDHEALLEDAHRLAHRIAPFVPVLCHNDVLPANVLDDGRRIWLVDWEYAGVGHPLFDLAGVSANAKLTLTDERQMLMTYRRSTSVDVRDLLELHILKAMSLLREALWSLIQTVASDIEFDYERYADDNFRAYRETRIQLGDELG
jgi:thiamine kinase-like enzyme